jgi:acetyl-CoA carboxylase carboxyl transferase subunit beta
MTWLTTYVRPRIRAWVGTSAKPDVPEHLWHQCPACERMIFHRDLEANQRVCPQCGHHLRVDAEHRLRSLLDAEGVERLEPADGAQDPLKFRDVKRYADRLKEAQARAGPGDALVAALGTIDGLPVVLAVMNFAFMGGSMGAMVGEAFVRAARKAVEAGAAFVVVTASGGARMQEGALSLMQMARTTIAVDEVKEAGLPYVVILTDPTTGGVTASFAMLGDVQLAERGAVIGFAGARVIEQTIREKLPDGFQRAEYLEAHGMVDMVVHRHELRATLARMLGLLMRPHVPSPGDGLAEPAAPAPVAPPAEEVADGDLRQ